MFTCRRKELPPSAHAFNKFWDIATEPRWLDVDESFYVQAGTTNYHNTHRKNESNSSKQNWCDH